MKRKSIQERFEEYHKLNPDIWDSFKDKVDEAVQAGRKRVSANWIINAIRWEKFIRLTPDKDVKINDHYASRYARLYQEKFPGRAEMFNTRKLKA